MSLRRTALLEKFRARGRERIASLDAALVERQEPEPGVRAELLGALHTLKGEARMLGLASIADLTHAIESVLVDPKGAGFGGRAGDVREALRALDGMLLVELAETEAAQKSAGAAVARLEARRQAAALAMESGPANVPAEAATPSALDESPATMADETTVGGEAAPTADASASGTSDLAAKAGERASAAPAAPASPAVAAVTGRTGKRERVVELGVAQVDELSDDIEQIRMAMSRLVARAASGRIERADLQDVLALVDDLAADASALRLAPALPVLAGLATHARELAVQQGKDVTVSFDASGVDLERSVLDALEEPLVHLVRNAVDHGVVAGRAGRLSLSATARGGAATIIVQDDGPGIDIEAVRARAVADGVMDRTEASALADDEVMDLVFRSGLSTRDVATDVSGRGLGLDVVRRVAEWLGGAVTVESDRQAGTRFTLSVPAFVARERVLLLRAGNVLLGVPSRLVSAVVGLASRTESVAGGEAIAIDGVLVPIRSLAKLVGLASDEQETHGVVVELGDRKWVLAVTTIVGERDVLRRPADAPLAALGFSGASTVLDDGRVVLLPTLAEVLRRAGGRGAAVARNGVIPVATRRAQRALVVDDSPIVRELVSELLSSAGLAVTQAEDGEAALAQLEAISVDIVVTDVEMPRLDGLELVRTLRARGSRLPIVVVTTRGTAEDRRRAAEYGADAYVVKTEFSEADLVGIVRRLVEAP